MNYGYSHGSQGNLMNSGVPRAVSSDQLSQEKGISKAPAGTGDKLRIAGW